jgi:hypothetical protein
MAKLTTHVRLREELDEESVRAMFGLYESYYDGTCLEVFREDLAGKSHVFELRADGRLRGFSTLAIIDFEFAGEPNTAIFSGDTIIEQQFWGEQELVRAFCRFAGACKASAPARPLFWLLISKGYRTYRYLETFARAYLPHHDAPELPGLQARLELLARRTFGASFDATAGVLRFPTSRGHLKPAWADVREPLREHPAVRFFLERNPSYYRGEELVCLTELTRDNLRSFARRAFAEGLGAGAEAAHA